MTRDSDVSQFEHAVQKSSKSHPSSTPDRIRQDETANPMFMYFFKSYLRLKCRLSPHVPYLPSLLSGTTTCLCHFPTWLLVCLLISCSVPAIPLSIPSSTLASWPLLPDLANFEPISLQSPSKMNKPEYHSVVDNSESQDDPVGPDIMESDEDGDYQPEEATDISENRLHKVSAAPKGRMKRKRYSRSWYKIKGHNYFTAPWYGISIASRSP